MKTIILFWVLVLTGCASFEIGKGASVYDQLGGQSKVEEIVDNFITEIEFDPIMYAFFKDSNIDRFRDKLSEHICFLTGGPCEYTGDSMEQVHAGMNITESDFNHSVDLLISSMNKSGVPHRVQNKVLATMVPTRREMIYK